MRTFGTLGRATLALMALVSAGAIGALAAPPVGLGSVADGWTADPDEQFLLDVNIRQQRLGDGVRAYATPEGTCIVFGDFLTALDVPMQIDLESKSASGWAFKEAYRIHIDQRSGQVRYGVQAEVLAKGAVRDVPEGWCVDSVALSRWFGIKVLARTNGSALVLESEAKLPVELAVERRRRAALLKKNASIELSSLPQVRLPYRMWRAPALDFVVSGGMTYRASTGTRIDRRVAVYAAGEVAHLSYNAQASTDDKGNPQSVRLRAFRSDPDGGLLGPLDATNFEFGDVAGYNSRLLGAGANGRGVAVTNQPLFTPASFDRTRFEGDLPAGWEAELYRNGQLLGFAENTGNQRYQFDEVQLLYGENRIDIVLYGPQGQVKTRSEMVNVGQDNIPPGETWYWAGVNQPGRDLVNFLKPSNDPNIPRAQATLSVAHGIDQQTSVGVTAQALQLDDERLTYVEGTVRRSIGAALVEVAVARDDQGGMAARAQMLTKIGSVNLSAEAIMAKDFRLNGLERKSVREGRLSLDAPLKIGRTLVPVHGDIRYSERGDGTRQLEAAARLSSHINRFNLAGDLRYRRQWASGGANGVGGPDPPAEIEGSMIASGRVGAVRIRGSSIWKISPDSRFKTAELSAYWSASEKADFEGAIAYDAQSRLTRARVTHIRRLDTMAVALTGEAASDGSVALGFNLNFSLDSSRRDLSLSRQQLATAGAVRATVFRDLNSNGRRDSGEPVEKGALITTGSRLAERTTDAQGKVLVAGLTNYVPVTVGIDTSSLSDPMLTPRKALQVVTPRPGIAADVEIALVGAGDIEGAVVKDGGEGFEGLELELVDASGKVVATTRSDYDGFFLFERVTYGKYIVRISAESANIAKVARGLGFTAIVSAEAPVARLGAARAVKSPEVAGILAEMASFTSSLR
ncbi:MAG: carboxypeptidase regulatory-like domain-containing protein [Sphingomonas bacterium]|nr:carboxypeptidase regulatory-like domain-containing protein [Sphingomonas bacterium]